MSKQWTNEARVNAVMKLTGCSQDDAREYLMAEEGSVEDAVISYKGDRAQAAK